jgi:hypothetical protein
MLGFILRRLGRHKSIKVLFLVSTMTLLIGIGLYVSQVA